MLRVALLFTLAQAPRQELVFPVSVELVQVVVSVTTKDGVPVRDLDGGSRLRNCQPGPRGPYSKKRLSKPWKWCRPFSRGTE